MNDEQKSFWDHLDDLRGVLLTLVAVTLAAALLCFVAKGPLFRALLWPADPAFPLYRLLRWRVAGADLINTSLAGQMMTHLQMALAAGVVVAFPALAAIVARYLAPALYQGERRALTLILTAGTALFYAGVATAYLIVFPVAYQFLMNYSVSPDVSNLITLSSYVHTLLCLALLLGALFELPVVFAALARLGLIGARSMTRYRRHALLAILVVVAVVTPTTDVFTLLVCAAPIYILYEASVVVVRCVAKKG